MPLSNFDKYFLNLPPLDKKSDFDQFWERAISEAKKGALETELAKNNRKSSHRFTSYDISYKSFSRTTINAELLMPRKAPKPKAIIHIHDYNNVVTHPQQDLDDSLSHLIITLRGHANLIRTADADEEHVSPGYIIENILDRDTYYVKAVYIDLYRSIDMLRLIPDINCSAIGAIGKGFGAAAAMFAAAFTDRIAALVLDTPAFCHLSMSQNIAESDATREINEFVATARNKKKQIKDNLTYFDALNFADRVSCPVLATVGFKDVMSPPECVFSLFNHIQSEKVMAVYPEEGNNAGGNAQFRKSQEWVAEQINK
jgi:cephalosporin-C deacetylase